VTPESETEHPRGTAIPATGRSPRRAPGGRTCAQTGCETRLSVYNRAERCWIHAEVRAYAPRGRRGGLLETPAPIELGELARAVLPRSA
jgi:hypothetical protein